MTGLAWLLTYHDRDLEWMCEFYNKHRGSQIYCMTFFNSISAGMMEQLWTRAKELKLEHKRKVELERAKYLALGLDEFGQPIQDL